MSFEQLPQTLQTLQDQTGFPVDYIIMTLFVAVVLITFISAFTIRSVE